MKNTVKIYIIDSIEDLINGEQNIRGFQIISWILNRYLNQDKSILQNFTINFCFFLLIWFTLSLNTILYYLNKVILSYTVSYLDFLFTLKKIVSTNSIFKFILNSLCIIILNHKIETIDLRKRMIVGVCLLLHPVSFIHTFFVLMTLLFLIIFYGTIFIVKNINLFDGLKIAFIADGNRRYLRKYKLPEDSIKNEGLEKMYELIYLCVTLKIKEVGFYCFSIKNFNRPSSEISNLFSVITDSEMSLKNIKPKFKVYGRLNLLPDKVREKLEKLVELTKSNNEIVVNIFIAYSTTDEVQNGILFNEDVDILIRSSGEKRLSDFLIRQCCKGTNIFFTSPLWPELSTFHVFIILLKYKLENYFFKTDIK